jgi:hypothetical protein
MAHKESSLFLHCSHSGLSLSTDLSHCTVELLRVSAGKREKTALEMAADAAVIKFIKSSSVSMLKIMNNWIDR